MKLPGALGSLFVKKNERKEYYLSLYLDALDVAGCAWTQRDGNDLNVVASSSSQLAKDSWEKRLEATDSVLAHLEEHTGTENLTKVIFGLPQIFLNQAGDIKPDIRSEIKKLTHALELEPVGFVPIHQALMYKMKKDEGIPPSIILLGVSGDTITISVYKVGSLVGTQLITKGKHIAESIEETLKTFQNLEVLPSRMLIYGSDDLEAMKAELMKHPWPTRVNFLHFPKIEIVGTPYILRAVSLAGASEMGEHTAISPPAPGEPLEEANVKEESISPLEEGKSLEEAIREEKVDKGLESHIEDVGLQEEPTLKSEEEPKKSMEEEVKEAKEIIEEDVNITEVAPEAIGFKKDVDILQKPERQPPSREPLEEEVGKETGRLRVPLSWPPVKLPPIRFDSLLAVLPRGGLALVILGVCALFLLVGGFLYWILPHANVVVYELPVSFDQTTQMTIDPTGSAVDPETKTIPGKSQEKSVSGEKTIPVTGKKNVGDPAKGTVTIYNKSLTSKTFKKGTVLSANSLQFTLDSDVTIASASETIGSITFEKQDVSITASAIGPQSNLPAGTEFALKDTSSSVAAARNDKALTGGTSRQVTVVTRGDYDAFVEDMSSELVEKAKQELASGVGASEKLIDATITTAVSEKVFSQELDQEATELSGKLTITVSGISYSDEDIKTVFKTLANQSIPKGYVVVDDKTSVSVSDTEVQKDGKIRATVTVTTVALPAVDTATITRSLSGKSIQQAEEYLRSIPGIAGVEFGFRFALSKSRLPINQKNISVSVAIQE